MSTTSARERLARQLTGQVYDGATRAISILRKVFTADQAHQPAHEGVRVAPLRAPDGAQPLQTAPVGAGMYKFVSQSADTVTLELRDLVRIGLVVVVAAARLAYADGPHLERRAARADARLALDHALKLFGRGLHGAVRAVDVVAEDVQRLAQTCPAASGDAQRRGKDRRSTRGRCRSLKVSMVRNRIASSSPLPTPSPKAGKNAASDATNTLATAAVAPALLLVFTAEIWDVGLSMSNRTAILYALLSIGAASLYLVQVQALFLPRKDKRFVDPAAELLDLGAQLQCAGLDPVCLVLGRAQLPLGSRKARHRGETRHDQPRGRQVEPGQRAVEREPVYGVQFHFEADREVVRHWNLSFADWLSERQPGWTDRMEEEAALYGAPADEAGLSLARAWVATIGAS